MFATEKVSANGEVEKHYAHKDVKTPLERLAELLERNVATLKRGQTLADLQERARAKTDLQAAQEIQKAKADLFALMKHPAASSGVSGYRIPRKGTPQGAGNIPTMIEIFRDQIQALHWCFQPDQPTSLLSAVQTHTQYCLVS